ncbi:hypothetical protein I4U23_002655 [Adineta vaga]|nr:hypothetical protein I4U23_002655 [Adineta vaga]
MSKRNEKSRAKFSQKSTHSEQSIFHRSESSCDRRNALSNTSSVSTSTKTFYQTQYYQQLTERVRELEKELLPDLCRSKVPSFCSSHSALTPCSSLGSNGLSNYSRPHHFPISLVSPSTFVPAERFGLSPKILERANEIPERFWIDWQEKQMQQRINELESMKSNSIDFNETDLATMNRRKSLLLLHNTQPRISLPQSRSFNTTMSSSTDNETSSSPSITDDQSLFNFRRRSLDKLDTNTSSSIKAITPDLFGQKCQSTLDRSQLTICLPFSHNTYHPTFTEQLPEETTSMKENPNSTTSSGSTVEDVANIDTELNLTLLSYENSNRTSPLLYSKATINQTVEFRSISKKTNSFE